MGCVHLSIATMLNFHILTFRLRLARLNEEMKETEGLYGGQGEWRVVELVDFLTEYFMYSSRLHPSVEFVTFDEYLC